ncbi:pyridoxal-dependent aspartate 1-decarboxylase PanP [Arenicella xantha]|uniref:Glutamate decarboxylase n=1 Tax=Arenicella xantha TaxID=644221 RepID=A0A395JR66_9GAMM|nr:putative pyridoxal-dependent aspartate 1-decarboxylase [Arenicella xantha]RBP53055.1 glutamate decarboxylase [Arenicella xantha]
MKNTPAHLDILDSHSLATASLENLYRIFTVPEAPNSTLGAIDKEISDNLMGFLTDRIVARERSLKAIEADFSGSQIPEVPQFVSDYTDFVLEKLVAQSVHTAAPGFIGHMATPLPYFMLPLSRIMVALNQNLVKIETSKAFTPLERQVLGMLHGMVYEQSDEFYAENLHNSERALGSFCSGGTTANITALWVARNRMFRPTEGFQGLAKEGIAAAMAHANYDRLAIVVSERGHYSLSKAADVLGIGRNNVISVPTDASSKISLDALRATCAELTANGTGIVSIVGIAGATETGQVDPLTEMAAVAQEFGTHFHVDAAWGGPTLLSNTYKHILKGIELADSVTIDAHKQLYVPMGAGMVVFKNPSALGAVEHHAEYILRAGSKDLGQYSIEGSRPGMAMLVHAAFHIIGRKGYEIIIDQNVQKAKTFARMIAAHPDFELITDPELNILNYRYVPAAVQAKLAAVDTEAQKVINDVLDRANRRMQKQQRAAGKTFVSRTRFSQHRYGGQPVSVFRVVMANPMTTLETLQIILDEQVELAGREGTKAILAEIPLES